MNTVIAVATIHAPATYVRIMKLIRYFISKRSNRVGICSAGRNVYKVAYPKRTGIANNSHN